MAERGWWGGLLDETAKLPQGIRQLVVDAVTRQPRTDPTQPVVTPGPGGLLDLTPVPALTEAYKATDDVGKGGYEGGQAVGKYLSGLLGIIPAVGAVRKAGPIRAYHASPHDFDKFDLNKIGTGEGSTVFGHGLYAAESPAVSGRGGAYDQLFTARNLGKYDLNQQEGMILKMIGEGKSEMEILRELARNGADFDQATAALERIKANKAHIYDVDIHADPAKLINWDKPITQQHPVVRKALGTFSSAEPVGAPIQRGLRNELFGGDLIGAPKATPAEISQELAKRGVPGIKYLDRGSRGGGAEGTSNYVVFDPKIIEIMRKYGLLPVAAGGAAAAVPGLLNQEKQY